MEFSESFSAEENSVTTQVLYQLETLDQDFAHSVQKHKFSIAAGDARGDFMVNTTASGQGWLFFSRYAVAARRLSCPASSVHPCASVCVCHAGFRTTRRLACRTSSR